MKSKRKRLSQGVFLGSLTGIFLLLLSLPAAAAQKTIPSVSIKVNHSIKAGDNLNSITLNYGSSEGGMINVYTNSETRYSIVGLELLNGGDRAARILDVLQLRVTLQPQQDGNDTYVFRGTYSSSNVHVTGGSFVSASKKGNNLAVTVRMSGIKGTFEAPYDVEWRSGEIGRGRWSEPADGTGYYDVILERQGIQILKIEGYKGSAFNFYPYMTQAGRYKFKVRTVPHTEEEKQNGQQSPFVEADEYYLDKENVSDGSGRHHADNMSGPGVSDLPVSRDNVSGPGTPRTMGKAGWILDNGIWYYKFPSGELKKNGWEKVGGKWYLFDGNGRMLTGWQKRDGHSYYLNNEGDMRTGWFKDKGVWYYLNGEAGATEGAMVVSTWLKSGDGKRYFMTANGSMAQGWTQIEDKWYFFYYDSGELAVNTTIDTFYLNEEGVWVR